MAMPAASTVMIIQ